MANNFSDPHLCPVCFERWVSGQSIYCSFECRRIASKYLNRVDYLRRNLIQLGFTVTKSDGIFFNITVPEAVKVYFPRWSHEICFPVPGLSVDCLNAESVLETIRQYLGNPVTQLIRHYLRDDLTPGMSVRNRFALDVVKVWEDPKCVSECPICHLTYITSEQGWDTQTDRCTDCAVAAIPF